ncbi:Oral-facial-digital syndrome 1 protein [Holothuria leucospilota]|uniref:Oral-facial-digital syndrome 1 protein n=1 Tax=Holothuria leucospilota TaxID=206669 RepID=A0A9Q1H141_HOLLE|nr:Oral-facial-digital syndrome 1 protein [Holothuria leucospilota]
MADENGSSMSAAELKSKLYQAFRQRGWEDSLKAQLRKKLVAELQQGALKQSFSPRSGEEFVDKHSPLTLRVVNSLIADHLRRCQYEYSLSVFLPESETSRDKMFTVQDLLELLHIKPYSSLFKKLNREIPYYEAKGFLWQLLTELVSAYGKATLDKTVQVEEIPSYHSSIEKKLSAVDDQYSVLDSERKLQGEQAVQERLLVIQKEIEAKARADMVAEIARYKETELKRLELDFREKSRKEVADARKEMELTLRAKVEAVESRERTATERIRHQQQTLERETYTQRQNLLDQLRELQQHETDLKREAEVNARAAKLEEDKRKAIEENLKFREASVENIEQNYEKKFQEEVKRFHLDQEVKWRERIHDLEKKERLLKEERKQVLEDKASTQRTVDELQDRKKQIKDMEEQLQEARSKVTSEVHRNEMLSEKLRGVVDYPIMKEDNAVLRRELENTKMRLAEAASEEKAEKRRNEELIKQLTEKMSRPSPELISLRGELERTRDQLHQERAIMRQKEEHWKVKVQEEVQRNLDLKKQMEDQTRQMQEMVQELSSLRTVLRETQRALQNEVYRRSEALGISSELPPTTSNLPFPHDRGLMEDLMSNSLRGTLHNLELSMMNEGNYGPVRDVDSSGEDEDSLSSNLKKSSDFMEETRARMRQLEVEAETLNRNYQEFQQRLAEPVNNWAASPSRNTTSGPRQLQLSPRHSTLFSTEPSGLSPRGRAGSSSLENDIKRIRLVDENVEQPARGSELKLESNRNHQKLPTNPRRMLFQPSPGDNFSRSAPGEGTYKGQMSKLSDKRNSLQSDKLLNRFPSGPQLSNVTRPEQDLEDVRRQERYGDISQPVDERLQDGGRLVRDGETTSGRREEEGTLLSREREGEKEFYLRDEIDGGSEREGRRDDEGKKQDEDDKRRRREEEEQREWEERRRKKEEERKRKEEEARERERQMLLELQRQEEQKESGPVQNQESQKPPEKESIPEAKQEDSGMKIDPVMQKYMEMVQQKRKNEGKKEEKIEQEESEISAGMVSQGSISGDEREDTPVHKEEPESEDPFEDW